MARRVIPCRVTDEYVRGAGVVVGAAGSHNDVALRLEFSPMWAGTARSIVWKDALGENATVTLLGTNLLEEGETEVYLVPIPAEAKALAGELSMTIKGATVSGETETSATLTTTARFVVMESDWDEDAEVSGDITATQAEQLRAELEEIKGDIVSTAEAAVSAAESASEAASARDAAVSAASSAAGSAAEAETSAEAAERSADKAAEVAKKAAQIVTGATVSVVAEGTTLFFLSEADVPSYMEYTGAYEVQSRLGGASVVLETENKVLTDNVEVHPVPQTEVSNDAGGKTLTIGG